jgi:recombination protein RecT
MTDNQPSLSTAIDTATPKPGNGVAKLSPQKILKAEVERYAPAIAKSLPSGYEGGADRFVRSVLNAIMVDKKGDLAKCRPQSIVGAALHAAQLGLEIGPLGEAYLAPYGQDCTFMAGYRGFIKLAYLAGFDTDAQEVREFDFFEYEYGTNAHLIHRPARGGERGKPYEWWALARPLERGLSKFNVRDLDWMNKREAVAGPFWKKWPEEMRRKSVIRDLMKTVPLSARGETLALAMNSDGLVREEIDAQPSDFASDEEIVDGEVVE